jgi:hypothetical protein
VKVRICGDKSRAMRMASTSVFKEIVKLVVDSVGEFAWIIAL